MYKALFAIVLKKFKIDMQTNYIQENTKNVRNDEAISENWDFVYDYFFIESNTLLSDLIGWGSGLRSKDRCTN